ncbi:hypothetical protein SDJN03_04045, partial [Cucurbita argyrosperma subsp. sororia]
MRMRLPSLDCLLSINGYVAERPTRKCYLPGIFVFPRSIIKRASDSSTSYQFSASGTMGDKYQCGNIEKFNV